MKRSGIAVGWSLLSEVVSRAKLRGEGKRFVRFCCYVPQLLLIFPGRVLLQDTGELQEPHSKGNVYL
jgi:hypothetical protein